MTTIRKFDINMNFKSINLSTYADPVMDELVSGEPNLENSILVDLTKAANGTVLEIGCGYGRITVPLAKRSGADFVGMDLSAPSIVAAREKGAGLPIEWIEGDARTFQLNRTFPFIFARGCVFDFMLTRTDQEAMLARVREHLSEDGLFAFDICYRPPNEMVNNREESEWFTMTDAQDREICFTGEDWYDHDKQLWFQKCWERLGGPTGKPLREPWELTLRYSWPQDVETLLYYNGFQVVDRYTDWFGTAPSAEDGASVFVCKKG